MQHYITQMKKVIPKNISAYFKTLIGHQNIFQKLAAQFIPQYAQILEANNYQFEDSILFSCKFKGDKEQERAKRKSYVIKQQQYLIVEQFIQNITFDKELNIQEIAEEFYNPNFNCCFINLEEIQKNETKYFTNAVKNQKQINDEMDKLSLFLFEYIKSIYCKENIEAEYVISFQEIQEFVYKIIRNRAKTSSLQLYQSIQSKLSNYMNQNQEYLPLIQLQYSIQEKQLDFYEMKIFIESLYKDIMFKFNEFLNKEFSFEVTHVILITYLQRITDDYVDKIMDSLKCYWDFKKHPAYSVLKQKLESLFIQYLIDKRLTGGIVEQEINKQLQYLIYSIDWIKECDAASAAMELLTELSQFHINVCQMDSQIQFKDEDFSVEILNNFKFYNLQKCQFAQEWWNNNINHQTNILIIFQIYVKLTQFPVFGEYTPNRKNALIQILRILNNGYYSYLNIQILEICENISHQLEFKICEEIEKQTNNPKQKILNKVEILIENSSIFIDSQFLEPRQLYCQITSSKGQDKEKYQTVLLQQKLDLISKLRENDIKSQQPSLIQFQVLSKNNSNVITLLINGFRTENDDKQQYWEQITQVGTIIALNWSSNQYTESGKLLAERCLPIVKGELGLMQGILKIGKELYNCNPYELANEEATKAGRYLAFLISEHQLFGGYQINIIAHCLGSVVLLECIRMLDKIYETNQKQYINQIMILGGVADKRKLQKRRWNSVGGKIYNIYSKNDWILSYLLKVAKVFEKPCGISKIYLGYKQVINCDCTNIIEGHDDYRKKLKTILIKTDFNNDFKFFTSNISEQF